MNYSITPRPLETIKNFIGLHQAAVIAVFIRGEEGAFFREKLDEVAKIIKSMPKTCEQDGKGEEAMAYLHYFTGGCDWYITEKDAGADDDKIQGQQSQAFGLSVIHEVELGYISLPDVFGVNAELDLHFTPTTIGELKKKHS